MKTKTSFLFILSIAITLVISACNSTGYDIEIIESNDLPVVKEDNSAGHHAEQPTEIFDNPGTDKNIVTSDKINIDVNKSNKTFVIQIGAFANPVAANKCLKNAKDKLGYDFNDITEGNLHKIKTGTINSFEEATEILERIKSFGYPDSFISEIK